MRNVRLNHLTLYLTAILLLTSVFSACQHKASYFNRKEDRDRAKELGATFYSHLKAKDYEAATQLLKKPQPSDQNLQVLGDSSIRWYGEIQNFDVKSSSSDVTVQSDTLKGKYEVIYRVQRSKGAETREKIMFVSLGDKIEIVKYEFEPFEKNTNADHSN